jgi:low affinity Fe/Cu permease
MDVAAVGETIFRSHPLRLALWGGKAVFLWVAVPVVFSFGMWQVYLSEEVFAIVTLTETLFRGGVEPDRQQEAKCLV